MTRTATIEQLPVTVEEVEELFQSEPHCDYRQVYFDTDEVVFACSNSAQWVHICRYCGNYSFMCEQHHNYFVRLPVAGFQRRCEACKTQVWDYRKLMLSMRRV